MLMRAKTSPRKKPERHLFGYLVFNYEDESDNYFEDETREVISHIPNAWGAYDSHLE